MSAVGGFVRGRWARRPVLAAAFAASAFAFCVPGATPAEAVERDIAWYMSRPGARAAVLDACRADHRVTAASPAECANAETAETRLWGAKAARRAGVAPLPAAPAGRPGRTLSPGEMLRSAEFWATNHLARVGALAACRVPGNAYSPQECAAARRGAAIAAAKG